MGKNKESEDGMMNEKEGKESEGGLGGFNDILGNLGSALDKVKKKKENKGEENKKKKGTGGGLDELLGNLGPLAAMAGGLGKDGGVNNILGTLGSALGNAKKNKEDKGEKNKESEDGVMNEK